MAISDWSTTAADNDDADIANGIDWRELMNPGQVNNSARAMMAGIKTWYDQTEAAKSGSVFIQSQTISSAVAAVDFTTGIDGTYDRYELVLDGVVPSTDDTGIRLQFFAGGAWQTSGYNFSELQIGNAASVSDGAHPTSATSAIWLTRLTIGGGQGVGNTAAYGGANLRVAIIKPADATVHTQVSYQGGYPRSSDALNLAIIGSGRHASAVAVTGFRISASTGNLAAGRISLYGVRKS